MDPELSTGSSAPNEGSHLALYRRWRAQTFDRIIGQDAVVTTLRNAVRTGQVSHALLFVGPRGTGKTSMARIVAKALNCTNLQDGDPCDACPSCVAIREGRALDVVELDAATNNKVDDMRGLLERTWTAPSDLRRKVYIIDEVQRIREGWDVLLRTLEEPPDHVAFIFCTTDASQIRPAVLSRVQRFDFRPLTVPQIEGKLGTILDADGRQADPDAVRLVARQAAGGMRDAESMLDQLLASSGDRLTVEAVRDLLGLVDAEVIASFLDALVRGDALSGLRILDELESTGRDLAAFLDQLVDALREALAEALGRSDDVATGRTVGDLTEAARRIAAIDPGRQGVGGVRFQLELALIGAAAGSRGSAAAWSTDSVERTTSSARVAVGPGAPPAEATSSVPADRSSAIRPAPPEMRPAPPEAGPRTEAGAPARAAAPRRSPASRVEAADVAAGPIPAERSSGDLPAVTAGPPATSSGSDGTVPEEGRPPATVSTQSALVSTPADGAPTDGAPTDSAAPGPTGPSDSPATADPAEAAPASAPASPSVPPALGELDQAWPGIVAELSKSPPIKPLIEVCRPIAIDGDVVTLGFPEGKSFLKDVAERRRATLEDGIGRGLGRPVVVRLVATNLDILPPPDDEDAERVLEAARRIFADDLVDAGEVG